MDFQYTVYRKPTRIQKSIQKNAYTEIKSYTKPVYRKSIWYTKV